MFIVADLVSLDKIVLYYDFVAFPSIKLSVDVLHVAIHTIKLIWNFSNVISSRTIVWIELKDGGCHRAAT